MVKLNRTSTENVKLFQKTNSTVKLMNCNAQTRFLSGVVNKRFLIITQGML